MPASALADGCVPGSDLMSSGFAEERCFLCSACELDEIRRKLSAVNALQSDQMLRYPENAVDPPLPRITS
jgi:hypothetical protein